MMREQPVKTTIRTYDSLGDFSRGMKAMHRQGWILREFRVIRSPQSLDLIRASAPGQVPQDAVPRIIAHFNCAAGAMVSRHPARRWLARSLLRLSFRLDQPVLPHPEEPFTRSS